MDTAPQIPRQHGFICTAWYPRYKALAASTMAELWAYQCWRMSILLAGLFQQHTTLGSPKACNSHFSSFTYALSSPAVSHFFKLTSACFSSFPFMDPWEVAPRPERSAGYRLKSTALNQYVSCGSCLPLPNYFIIILLFILKFSIFFFYFLLNWLLFKNYVKVLWPSGWLQLIQLAISTVMSDLYKWKK